MLFLAIIHLEHMAFVSKQHHMVCLCDHMLFLGSFTIGQYVMNIHESLSIASDTKSVLASS